MISEKFRRTSCSTVMQAVVLVISQPWSIFWIQLLANPSTYLSASAIFPHSDIKSSRAAALLLLFTSAPRHGQWQSRTKELWGMWRLPTLLTVYLEGPKHKRGRPPTPQPTPKWSTLQTACLKISQEHSMERIESVKRDQRQSILRTLNQILWLFGLSRRDTRFLSSKNSKVTGFATLYETNRKKLHEVLGRVSFAVWDIVLHGSGSEYTGPFEEKDLWMRCC